MQVGECFPSANHRSATKLVSTPTSRQCTLLREKISSRGARGLLCQFLDQFPPDPSAVSHRVVRPAILRVPLGHCLNEKPTHRSPVRRNLLAVIDGNDRLQNPRPPHAEVEYPAPLEGRKHPLQ